MQNINIKFFGQVFAVMALMLSLCSFPVMAQDRDGCKCMSGHHKMHEKFESMLTQAGVTPDQKQKLDAIWQQAKTQADPIRTSLFEKKKALFEYISCPQATKEQALSQAQAISQLQLQLETIRINSMFQAKCVLTPDQQQKLSQLIKTEMQKHKMPCPVETPPVE